MSPRHPYGESRCQRKSFFSLWFLCFFAANCFFQVEWLDRVGRLRHLGMDKREKDMIPLVPNALIHSVIAFQLVLAQELGKVPAHDDLLVLPVSRELSLNVVMEHFLQLRPRVGC